MKAILYNLWSLWLLSFLHRLCAPPAFWSDVVQACVLT